MRTIFVPPPAIVRNPKPSPDFATTKPDFANSSRYQVRPAQRATTRENPEGASVETSALSGFLSHRNSVPRRKRSPDKSPKMISRPSQVRYGVTSIAHHICTATGHRSQPKTFSRFRDHQARFRELLQVPGTGYQVRGTARAAGHNARKPRRSFCRNVRPLGVSRPADTGVETPDRRARSRKPTPVAAVCGALRALRPVGPLSLRQNRSPSVAPLRIETRRKPPSVTGRTRFPIRPRNPKASRYASSRRTAPLGAPTGKSAGSPSGRPAGSPLLHRTSPMQQRQPTEASMNMQA